ncbi:MAG: PD-(D/E)XK nuclease family protein [Candidatus Pacearchaeota archaeon]
MGEVKWSASRIDVANYCRMRYWLKYVEHAPESILPAFPKGSLLHNIIVGGENENGEKENFWTRLGNTGDLVKVERSKRGEVKKYHYRGKAKYHDAKSFALYAMGKWSQILFRDDKLRRDIKKKTYSGKELEDAEKKLIAWRDENHPWEIRNQIGEIAEQLFDILIDEGKPFDTELAFDFVLRNLYFAENPKNLFNLWFSGRIDEVRLRDGKVVIRDYKSGNPFIDQMKVKHDLQLTLYNAGLCSLVIKDDNLAEKLGLLEKRENYMGRRKDYMGNPIFIDNEFEEEFFMIEAPFVAKKMLEKNPDVRPTNLPKILHKSVRRNEHFFELMRMIKGTEESVNSGIIYAERGRKCDLCSFKYSCEKKLEDALGGGPKEDNGQELFDFVGATYGKKFIVNEGNNPITISPVVSDIEHDVKIFKRPQRRFNFKRKTSY